MEIHTPINVGGMLSEIKLFALSQSAAITKATLQSQGWAICDGTDIVTTQGITDAIITGNAPDLQQKFLRMSNDESSGGIGGSDTHTHSVPRDGWGAGTRASGRIHTTATNDNDAANDNTTGSQDSKPSYYELAHFIKVK